jgi:streptogramin lyase
MRITALRLSFVIASVIGFSVPTTRAATVPVITEIAIPSANAGADFMTTGSDGQLWFTEQTAGKIGRVSGIGTAPVVSEFPLPNPSSSPGQIASGPDAALWFVEPTTNMIGRITTGGTVTEFPIPSPASMPAGIAPAPIMFLPSGAVVRSLWFTEAAANKVANITTDGVITEYPIPTPNAGAGQITLGPDLQSLWFIEKNANKIGKIILGTTPTIVEYSVPTSNAGLGGIAANNQDFSVYFTETTSNKIGQISANDGTVTEYVVPTVGSAPTNIFKGTDLAMWFTEGGTGKIGRLTASFGVTAMSLNEYAIPTPGSAPSGIVAASDNALWFTEIQGGQIGRITAPTNTITVNLSGSGQGQLTSNAFTSALPSNISCGNGTNICTATYPSDTTVNLFGTAASGSTFVGFEGGGCPLIPNPCSVPLTADTNVTGVFNLTPVTEILSIASSGTGTGTVTSSPSGIACGATCNASFPVNTSIMLTAKASANSTFVGWSGGGCVGIEPCSVTLAAATNVTASFIANSSSDVVLFSSLLPTSRSVQVGSTATFYGSLINASSDTSGIDCTVSPTTSVPAAFSFQTTNPANNALIGSPNTPVNIPPGATQTYLLEMTPSGAFSPTDIAFSFACANSTPAASNKGLNTLLLGASTDPTPDIVALAATLNNDGIVNIPGANGTGVFAVASVNVGASATVTVSANVGSSNAPVSISICQTNPSTGQCLAPPTTNVPVTINANATPTFGLFVTGTGSVPFMPAVNRVFVQFQDVAGLVRGSTSVAVRTQ